MAVLKLCGMGLLLLTGWSVGMKKAAALRLRVQRLTLLQEETEELYHRLKYEGLERERLLLTALPHFCTVKDGRLILDENGLAPEDGELFREMIQKLGSGNSATEEKRALYYLERFRQQSEAAKKIAETNGKIYQTFGLCAGIMMCIFLW